MCIRDSFLGTSETVGDFEELFAVVDRKSRIYRRKGDLHVNQRVALGRFLAPVSATAATALTVRQGPPKPAIPAKTPLRELTEQALLAQAAPAAVLVASSPEGKEVAARLAVKLGSGLITDAVDVQSDGAGGVATTQTVFAGSYTVKATVTKGTPVLSLIHISEPTRPY